MVTSMWYTISELIFVFSASRLIFIFKHKNKKQETVDIFQVLHSTRNRSNYLNVFFHACTNIKMNNS